jgi:hypothetical protein
MDNTQIFVPINALKRLYYSSQNSAKNRLIKGRIEAGKHEIDFDYIKNLWVNQNSKCYYSNIPMNYNKHEWKVSLERLNQDLGYIKDNVVLCCLEFNGICQWSLDKIDEMLNILNQNINSVKTNFKSKIKTRYYKGNKLIIYNIKYYKCDYCKEFKTEDNFKKLNNNICKTCIIKNKYPHIKIQNLYHSACGSSKLRGIKNIERSIIDIDTNFLIELYNKQNGLCAYSGLPLKFGSYLHLNWSVSLERIDVCKGYIKNNVCLICYEFNTLDKTIITGSEYGCAGWNPLKFQYFLAFIKHKKGLISDLELQAIIDIQKIFKEKIQIKYKYKGKIKYKYPHNISDIVIAINKYKRSYINAHELYGHVYSVTSPSGKQFIGKSDLLFHKGNHAIFVHARKFGYTKFIKEIDEYGEDKMIITRLASCKKEKLDFYVEYFINMFNTYEPHGLNNKTKVRDDVKKKISNTLIDNAIRYDHRKNLLPKYVKIVDWHDRQGYSIVSHPKCKLKYFVSKKKSLDILLGECLEYLKTLD